MSKHQRLVTMSATAFAVLAAITGPAPAQANPLPPWCGLPDPLGVAPGCQLPTPQPTPQADPAPPDQAPPPVPVLVGVHFRLFGPPGTVVNSVETVPPTDPIPGGTPVPVDRFVMWPHDLVEEISIRAVGEQHAGPGCQILVGEPGSAERPTREVARKEPGSSVVTCSPRLG